LTLTSPPAISKDLLETFFGDKDGQVEKENLHCDEKATTYNKVTNSELSSIYVVMTAVNMTVEINK
jgi:hypothetical protein